MYDVGMVEEPIDGCGGEGLRHDLVESAGVQVAADREASAFVGCVNESQEAFGGIGTGREETDVVDADEIGSADLLDGAGGGVVDAVFTDEAAEVFEREPGDLQIMIDGLLPERFEEVALPGSAGAAQYDVLPPIDPFEGLESFCVAWGMLLASSLQVWKVLPFGKLAMVRLVSRPDRSRPVASRSSRTRRASAGSHRWLRAVLRTSGAALRR